MPEIIDKKIKKTTLKVTEVIPGRVIRQISNS